LIGKAHGEGGSGGNNQGLGWRSFGRSLRLGCLLRLGRVVIRRWRRRAVRGGSDRETRVVLFGRRRLFVLAGGQYQKQGDRENGRYDANQTAFRKLDRALYQPETG
jgi:hypothetical protein